MSSPHRRRRTLDGLSSTTLHSASSSLLILLSSFAVATRAPERCVSPCPLIDSCAVARTTLARVGDRDGRHGMRMRCVARACRCHVRAANRLCVVPASLTQGAIRLRRPVASLRRRRGRGRDESDETRRRGEADARCCPPQPTQEGARSTRTHPQLPASRTRHARHATEKVWCQRDGVRWSDVRTAAARRSCHSSDACSFLGTWRWRRRQACALRADEPVRATPPTAMVSGHQTTFTHISSLVSL